MNRSSIARGGGNLDALLAVLRQTYRRKHRHDHHQSQKTDFTFIDEIIDYRLEITNHRLHILES